MVSKIAVMALVAVVAVPILLGYGLNIETESYDAWEESGNIADLSQLLTNVTDKSKSTYTDADMYLYNSRSFYKDAVQVFPTYQQTTTTYTPIKLKQEYVSQSAGSFTIAQSSDSYVCVVVDGGYDAVNYITLVFTFSDSTTQTFTHLKEFYWSWQGTAAIVDASRVDSGDAIDGGYSWDNVVSVTATAMGPVKYLRQYSGNSYVDIAKGYRLNTDFPAFTTQTGTYYYTGTYAQGTCKSMYLTFNLDSITQSDYWMAIHFNKHDAASIPSDYSIQLIKKTTGSGVQWSYMIYGDDEEHILYFNPDLTSNTYQLYLNGGTGGEWRYVGAWEDTLSVKPAIITYPFTYENVNPDGVDESNLPYFDVYGQTPVMRIDAATVAAYEYRIIQDVTFTPLHYLGGVGDNPVTTLSNIVEYGSSIVFGGQTFNVTDGKITLDGKSIPLSGMRLDSVSVDGAYENRINGTVVSTTADPSDITLNGDWVLTVKTVGQQTVTKESTHWVAGKFAWNGIDTNFKIAGLMTCVVAFIALGIYARYNGGRMLPLLLVCGGAAFMFLLML